MSKDDDRPDPFDESVVNSLLRVDTILDLYRQKKRERDEEVHVEEPSMPERVMMAQVINQVHMTSLMTAGVAGGLDTIMKRIDDLRTGLFEEIKAHVEGIMTGKFPQPASAFTDDGPATREEIETLNRMLTAGGSPVDYETMLDMAPQQAAAELYRLRVSRKTPAAVPASEMAVLEAAFNPPPTKMIVQVVPADVHAAFEDVLFKGSVNMPEAKRVLELLVSTKQGKDMLALMVHDAVKIQRRRDVPPPA